ncbi:hypothetical protein EJB05_13282, partial [Eragrostis curvula]
MAHALVPLALFFLLATPAPAARTVADTVQELCAATAFPKVCSGRLTALPESQKATPRKLAEMFVNIAAEGGAGMAAFVHGKLNSVAKADDSVFKCYDSCSDDVEEAVAHLNGLVREPTDGKFLELKSWLSSTLGGASTCEDACKDAPKSGDVDAVVKYSVDFEKLLRITLDLITEASGSMAADIALPPSDAAAPAYGAAAFGGYGAAAPGPEVMAVEVPASSGDDAAAPSDAPSEAAPGPTVKSVGPAYPADADAPSEAAPGPTVKPVVPAYPADAAAAPAPPPFDYNYM